MSSDSKKTLSLPRKSSADDSTSDEATPIARRSGARSVRAQARKRRRQPSQPRPTAKTTRGQTPHSGTPVVHKRARTKTAPTTQATTQAPKSKKQNLFFVFAPCPQGLEEVLEQELQQLGFKVLERGRAGCRFETDWVGILRANLYSRIATRILVQLTQAPVRTPDDVYALAYDTEWEKWFGPRDSLRVDTSALRSPMQSLQYCNLRVKDAICDRLRAREGARPDVDTVRPDAKVHLFLDESSATLYLDSSGESLFKRGWRKQKGAAPLRENLAAGLLALAGWQPNQPLIDPFCGSGTILIEAAWMALNAPPGLHRPFHFERLRNHNPRIWNQLKDKARSEILPTLDTPLIGADIDAQAIEQAKENLHLAKLGAGNIEFRHANALEVLPTAQPGFIVTNPPYGERLDEQLQSFWFDWSAHLKSHYDGWNVNLISSDLDLPGHLRLKANRRFPVFNGPLDCRLFQFEIQGRDS